MSGIDAWLDHNFGPKAQENQSPVTVELPPEAVRFLMAGYEYAAAYKAYDSNTDAPGSYSRKQAVTKMNQAYDRMLAEAKDLLK